MTQFTSGRGRPWSSHSSITSSSSTLRVSSGPEYDSQHRFEGTSSGAVRVAREEHVQVGEVE